MDEILKDIDRVHQGIQHLRIESTQSNVAIIMDALQVLKEVYNVIKERSQEEKARS